MSEQKIYTIKQGLDWAKDYCSKNEHCPSEISEKLKKTALTEDEIEQIIAELISQNFLNQQRYAKLYAISKFHQNQWGKVKISYMLKQKKISEPCIKKALDEIKENEYFSLLSKLYEQKIKQLNNLTPPVKDKRLISFLYGKGFELNDIINLINNKKQC